MEEKWISIFSAVFSGKVTSSTYSLLIVTLGGLLWGAFRIYASTGQPFTLPTPSEHRIKTKIASLKNELTDATDLEVRAVLASDVARLQFMLARGSDLEAVQRNELLGVHKHASAQITWRQVYSAAPYLRYEMNKVVEGMSRVINIVGWYFLLSGFAEIFATFCLMFWVPSQVTGNFVTKFIVAFILAFPFALFGIVSLRFAQPIRQAYQLQGAIRRWRIAQDATSLAPPPQIVSPPIVASTPNPIVTTTPTI